VLVIPLICNNCETQIWLYQILYNSLYKWLVHYKKKTCISSGPMLLCAPMTAIFVLDMIGGIQGIILLQAILNIMHNFWAQFKTCFPIACISSSPYLLVLLLQFYWIFVRTYYGNNILYILNLLDIVSKFLSSCL